MKGEYKVVYKGGEGEISEKKSRFIAVTAPVESEQEALDFIEKIKKEHWNAAHNCSAFVIGQNMQRCSDDGEPSGTAGKPMLDVLTGQGLFYTAVVVTRYFGGTLLGTGGLVKAYTKAVQEGLAGSTIITKTPGVKAELICDYQLVGKIQYILAQNGITTTDSRFEADVWMEVLLPLDQKEKIKAELIEATNGQTELEEKENVYFAKSDGEILIFEMKE